MTIILQRFHKALRKHHQQTEKKLSRTFTVSAPDNQLEFILSEYASRRSPASTGKTSRPSSPLLSMESKCTFNHYSG